ncbi:DUF2232 domain-containing protein [Oricola sp.]|uniref:DUF2232 domain-containing protein n=1 Tax=Oricola sp. TaxID=1979950 RepID=UPI0025F02374|nr:DUF2232 domain-containing protein [Oricola sp.]MCI5077226.1 DUF2232 domain-containing protein [Oricola sp.]
MNQASTPQWIGFGALAGATTALLCLGLSGGSMMAVLLFFISPVPVMVAGLGFGLKAALTGAFIAVAGTLAFANGLVAILVALAIAAPACASSYWLNLARPAEEIGGPQGRLAWYPLADVLFANALFTGFAYVVLGAMIGFGPELAAGLASELIAQLRQTNPEIVFTPEGEASLAEFMATVIPFVQPFFWMLALTLSIYIATAIARRSNLVNRPREDWPLALRMPRIASFAFMAALVASFVSGGIGHAAASLAGALGAGFTLAGFAMLHARTRGMGGRAAILLIAYLSIPFIGFTTLIFLIAGMFGAGRHVPLSPVQPTKPTQIQND